MSGETSSALEEKRVASPSSSTPLFVTGRCLVCGAELLPQKSACGRCHAPKGTVVDPEDATGSRFLLVVPLAASEQMGKKRAPSYSLIGWHWGAAFLTLFWVKSLGLKRHFLWNSFFNALFLLAVAIELLAQPRGAVADSLALFFLLWALVWVSLRCYYGLQGMALALRSGQYIHVEELMEAQKRWQRAGLWTAIVGLCLIIIALILAVQ